MHSSRGVQIVKVHHASGTEDLLDSGVLANCQELHKGGFLPMDRIPTHELPPRFQNFLAQDAHWTWLPNGNRQVQIVLVEPPRFVTLWIAMAAQNQANRDVFLNFRSLASAVLEYTQATTTLTLTQAPNAVAFLAHTQEILPPNLVPTSQSDPQKTVTQWAQRVTPRPPQTRAPEHEIG